MKKRRGRISYPTPRIAIPDPAAERAAIDAYLAANPVNRLPPGPEPKPRPRQKAKRHHNQLDERKLASRKHRWRAGIYT